MSIGALQPFASWFAADPVCTNALKQLGVDAAEVVDPQTRLPSSACTALLQSWLTRGLDPRIGLLAALLLEPGDLGVVEQAARHCRNLRGAIECGARFLPILHEGLHLSLDEHDGQASVHLVAADGASGALAATDFALGALFKFVSHNLGSALSDWSVSFTNPEPPYAASYGDLFTVPVRFAAPISGLVFPLPCLDAPMRYANEWLASAFASEAERRLEQARGRIGTADRVRRLVAHKLGNERLSMRWVASCMGISIPTLRRRLELEGTTFTAVADAVRFETAERLLGDATRTVSEVAALVGYSGIAGLNRALVRHAGVTAGVYRERLKSAQHAFPSAQRAAY